MDPKALSHLDPKQREAYDRVMGHADGSNPITVSSDSPPATDAASPGGMDPNIISANPSAQGISDPTASSPLSASPLSSDANTGIPSFDASLAPDANAEPQANFGEPGPIDISHLGDNPSDNGATPASPQDGMTSFDASPKGSDELSAPAQSDASPSIFSAGPQPADTAAPTEGSSNNSFFSNTSPADEQAAKPSTFDSPTQLGPDQPSSDAPSSSDILNSSTPVTPYTPTPIGDNQPFNQPLPSPAEVNHAGKDSSALLKVLYIVGAVVFFAIYTIFWIKVFDLPFIF